MQNQLSWKAEWSTGIPSLDAQHSDIAERINQAMMYADKSVDGEKFQRALEDLYATAKSHFKDEERLMSEEKYPSYASHVREHVMLLAELKSTISRLTNHTSGQTDGALSKAIKSWYIAHAVSSDRGFAEYLKSGQEQT